MNWLLLTILVLRFADKLVQICYDEKLMKAGEARALKRHVNHAKELLQKSIDARNAAVIKFDELNGLPDESDPNLRD